MSAEYWHAVLQGFILGAAAAALTLALAALILSVTRRRRNCPAGEERPAASSVPTRPTDEVYFEKQGLDLIGIPEFQDLEDRPDDLKDDPKPPTPIHRWGSGPVKNGWPYL